MAVIYLDPEDEITGAAQRLRALSGGNVVLVLPAGSRLGTSRINFRLLAREARQRQLKLATVSDEPSVRAISAAAGVPSFATVEAAEAGLGEEQLSLDTAGSPKDAPAKTANAPPKPLPPIKEAALEDTLEYIPPPRTRGARPSIEPPIYGPGEGDDDVLPGRRRGGRRRPRLLGPAIVAVLLLALLAIGGYAAYLFVPTATITLNPRLNDVGPLSTRVTADPRVAVADPAAGLIPAQEIAIPIVLSNSFPSTGVDVTTTAATGRVRFSSQNTFVQVPIPAGTVVSTANGIEFTTTQAVTVPVANFSTQTPGTVMANIVASQRGVRGNVNANAIKRVPESLSALLVSVRNPQATSGGSRVERAVVTQEDYDVALEQLTAGLSTALATKLADPATTPRGLTLFATSAELGPATPDKQPEELVDTAADTFTLQLSSSATVLAVNEALVDELAQAQLQALKPAGTTLLPSTVNTTHAPGLVVGRTVAFNVSGMAKSWRPPDTNTVLREITGKSVSEARTIMEKYGSVEIAIWPEFIDRLPDQNRIRLTIIPPQENP